MTVKCPYCRHGLGMKHPKPGRFTPRCPKCQKKLLLTVPDDLIEPPVVSKLPSEEPVMTLPGPAAPPEPTGAWERPTEPPSATGSAPDGIRMDPIVPDDGATRLPSTLGGYRVLKLLGRGGMGAVYLAKRRSLRRLLALKVMRPEWANRPTFVSRITRDAYAAAQISHHNLVQIDDLGEDKGTPYFVMEFVPGRSLADLLRQRKRLDPEVAVGYALQAARGLKHAHDQGLVHRDIKPGNLLLSDQGIVKVADLGLAKTPSVAEVEAAVEAGVTTVSRPTASGLLAEGGPIALVNAAMGTPAFMAPEQARDALSADARADIYSLGCTLYHLVTGRPPFEGTAVELMRQHQTEPMVPPETIAPRVPKALSTIILKMTAKRPEDRYGNISEVIKALEDHLGLPGAGVFTPREEHAALVSESAEAFNTAPSAVLRSRVLLGASAGWTVFVILFLLARKPSLVAAWLGLGAMTAFVYFVVNGLRRTSPLFAKTVEFLTAGSLTDWLVLAATVLLLVIALYVTGVIWGWLFFGFFAVLAAVGIHWKIDRPLDAERVEPLEKTRAMLRTLRLSGVDEDAVRQFVCKYSGTRWEEFHEALFGYESKLDARRRWGRAEAGVNRPRFAFWRDPIMAWLDARRDARRQEKEKALLQKIEEKSLESQGVNLMTARRKARRIADSMVAVAAERKSASRHFAAGRDDAPPPIGKALREAALRPEETLVERETGLIRRDYFGPILAAAVGPKVRFLVGAVLMAGFMLWARQNRIFTEEQYRQLKEVATKAVQERDVKALGDAAKIELDLNRPTKELDLGEANVPPQATRALRLFNGFNPGVAGLILLVSSLFGGWRVGVGTVVGAAIALVGPLLTSVEFGPLNAANASMVVGATIGLVAVLFGRERR